MEAPYRSCGKALFVQRCQKNIQALISGHLAGVNEENG
jgi:hypothetical protein